MCPADRALGIALALATSLGSGCGGGGASRGADPAPAGGGGSQHSIPAPPWFKSPPHSTQSLFFVGDATGAADEGTARDLARSKALHELTTFCGASIKSEGQSLEREANGKYEQVVSLTVDVAGDELTVREAVVRQAVTGRGADGTYDAFVLLEWPRAEYEGVRRAQADRAGRALALYLEADTLAKDLDVLAAGAKLKEAKAILGPMRTQVPLDHPTYRNSGLLWDAISALSDRLAHLDQERKAVFAVALLCTRETQPIACRTEHAGTIGQAVARGGAKVSAEKVPEGVAREILTSSSPKPDRTLRSAGFVVAVELDAELIGKDQYFSYYRGKAHAVLFDTETNRIVDQQEFAGDKVGHPSGEQATEKAFSTVEKQVTSWVEGAVGKKR